ncbi:MAG: ABC transporter ATP-binding protein [Candidatus Micrarchaeota archaeon]
MALAVSVHDASVAYGKNKALSNCSIEVEQGIVFGLLGPNGAGKSTLMKAISGQLALSSGTVELFGRDLFYNLAPLKEMLGIVPQDYSFAHDFTVEENLRFIARLYGLSGKNLEKKIEGQLADYFLAPKRSCVAGTLSGGYKRLLNFALSTMHEPKLLLLDEPTVGLDPDMRETVWGMVRSMRKKGMTMVLTTHYLEEATSLCDRIAIIFKGSILVLGNPSDIIEQYGGNTTIFLNLSASPAGVVSEVGRIRGVVSCEARGDVLVCSCANKEVVRVMAAVNEIIKREDLAVNAAYVQEATLDDAFKSIVARQEGVA